MVKNVIILILILCLLLQSFLYYQQNRKKKKEIEDMIAYLTAVQDRMELPQLNQLKEGQLSILQSEIYKVVVLLRQAYSQETIQKRYMADLLSDISHQIKTPISAITIMADLLESSELSEEQRLTYAGKIDKQAKRITWLIRNLLNYAQLEAQVLQLKRERTDITDILGAVKDSLEIMAELKNVNLVFPEETSISLYCDVHWTTEALLNIAKNCVEHTGENGTVKISVFQDNFATHIHICDNGEGISKEHLPHIFERFYKADNTSGNSVGIGLAMAKQIILKQNGTITATSEVGKGTKFWIKLFRTETV